LIHHADLSTDELGNWLSLIKQEQLLDLPEATMGP